MITNLLTKYILAPSWARILLFITFYFIVREFHFLDLDFSDAECMPPKPNFSNMSYEHFLMFKKREEEVFLKEQEISNLHLKDKTMRRFAFNLRLQAYDAEKHCSVSAHSSSPTFSAVAEKASRYSEISTTIDEYVKEVVSVRAQNTKLIAENVELRDQLTRSEVNNLALTQKLASDIPISSRIEPLNRLRRQILQSAIERSQPTTEVETKISTLSRNVSNRASIFDQTNLIKTIQEKQALVKKLNLLEEQLAAVTQEKAEMYSVFREESNTMFQMIVELHQENEDLRTQLGNLETRIKELSQNPYPGAQRTNPFTTLRK